MRPQIVSEPRGFMMLKFELFGQTSSQLRWKFDEARFIVWLGGFIYVSLIADYFQGLRFYGTLALSSFIRTYTDQPVVGDIWPRQTCCSLQRYWGGINIYITRTHVQHRQSLCMNIVLLGCSFKHRHWCDYCNYFVWKVMKCIEHDGAKP